MFYHIKKYPFSYILAFIIWILCMIPIPETPLDEINFIDKWTHFVMYATFTSCIWWEYKRNHVTRTDWKRLITGGMICPVIMGCLIEVAQAHLTTCRSGEWFDAVCNSIGVMLGALINYIVLFKGKGKSKEGEKETI